MDSMMALFLLAGCAARSDTDFYNAGMGAFVIVGLCALTAYVLGSAK